MAASIIWSPRAEETFDEITDNLLERWSEKVVVKFVQQAFKAIDRIAIFPNSCPGYDKEPGVRFYVINKHVSLFYRIQGDEKIELITFWNNRQGEENIELWD